MLRRGPYGERVEPSAADRPRPGSPMSIAPARRRAARRRRRRSPVGGAHDRSCAYRKRNSARRQVHEVQVVHERVASLLEQAAARRRRRGGGCAAASARPGHAGHRRGGCRARAPGGEAPSAGSPAAAGRGEWPHDHQGAVRWAQQPARAAVWPRNGCNCCRPLSVVGIVDQSKMLVRRRRQG